MCEASQCFFAAFCGVFDISVTLILAGIFQAVNLKARVLRGLASTKFGLIEVNIVMKPNWILGAVQ
ncbi:hypothetical protein EEO52_09675 [Staphylococcus pseudintermedius]|nr:hypothetical protein [Staphylococcus pseudintermedius]EGQ1738880.1 hypothetical protein [Staphylococcus pseudintermedius]EGQ4368219.1 hypothetical protein [Staphylococcus pseudintermedius]EGQ4373653.1 hypothetical protein [Staphylococcus pseudintermedius]EGQ4450559.1 hypothetical protein [Staphylococcus pseudintermedius]